jgi:hypothetical protein
MLKLLNKIVSILYKKNENQIIYWIIHILFTFDLIECIK